MKRFVKKAFTLVELLVVIAILGLLTTVGIISYNAFTNKADLQANKSLLTELNNIINYSKSTDNASYKRVYDVYELELDNGFDIENIGKKKSNYHMQYNSETEQFFLVDDQGNVIEGTKSENPLNNWAIINPSEVENYKYNSVYLKKDDSITELTVYGNVDVGRNTSINLSYAGATTPSGAKSVTFYTNGGVLNIDAPYDNVDHYGYAEAINVKRVAMASYNEYGTVPFINVSQGHVEITKDAWVNAVHISKVAETDTKFDDNILITVATEEIPKFSRDSVDIPVNTEIKVCSVEIEETVENIYLTNDGIYEQIKLAEVSGTGEGTRTFIEGEPESSSINTIADQVANNIVLLDGTKMVKDVHYELDDTTKEMTIKPAYVEEKVVLNGVTAKEAKASSELSGGTGLFENDPFEIYDFYTFQKISEFYDIGYRYFKVKDGVTSIDLSGWVPVKLNGSFDGNGVTLDNCTDALFSVVGKDLHEDNILIKDYSVNMNYISDKAGAMIKQIDNAGTTTFKDVSIHGYIEGSWNTGSFYNYGTANYDSKGKDYTVTFDNAKSDATLVSTTSNTLGGMIGHTYVGIGNHVTLNFNNGSEYTGKMYSTNRSNNKYYGIEINGTTTVNIDGVPTVLTSSNMKYGNVSIISTKTPEKKSDGYFIDQFKLLSGSDSMTVGITCSLTAYDNQNQPIPNVTGITISLTCDEVRTTLFTTKILDLFSSVEIINDSDLNGVTRVENGVLKVYTGTDTNYVTGVINLQVNQYNKAGNIIAVGTLKIAEKTSFSGSWSIK